MTYHFETYQLAQSVAGKAQASFAFMTVIEIAEIVYEAYTFWAQCHMQNNKPSEAKAMVCAQYEQTDYSPAIYRRAARRMMIAAHNHKKDLKHVEAIALTRFALDEVRSTDDAVVSACCAALA